MSLIPKRSIFKSLSLKNMILGACLAFIAGVVAAQQNQSKNALPEIGVVAADAISIDKEQEIGDIMMRQLRGQAPVISDPLLEEYIQDLGNRLVAQAQDVKFPFKFFLINNRDINAFAFFGGHIGVHTGLIFHASDESELASVLAHEVAHVTQRHIARSIKARQKSSPLQLASMFAGILLALADPEAGMAALSASNAAAAQAQINYTRSNEREADRIGLQILSQAGFDPSGAARFFGKLLEQNRMRSRPMAFLLTHPLPESRVSDTRARALNMPSRRLRPSLSFHLVKARIRARFAGNPRDNVKTFESMLDKGRYVFKEAAEYGLALSLFADEEYDRAETIINRLRKRDPNNLYYIDTATDIALEKGQHKQAIAMLQKQLERAPHNGVLTLNLANAAIKDEQFQLATNILKDFLLVNPNHFLALQLLSDAYGENKQMLEMHQNQAEIYALVGAYTRAIDELHTAYTFADQRKLEKQRIRARIDQIRAAQERLKTL